MLQLSNILPVPFVEKGALKTWDIKEGYDIDCACELSGSTDSGSSGVSNTLLQSILTQLQSQNEGITQTIFTTSAAGSIPAGVQSWSVTNLGVDPTDPLSTVLSMIIDGETINNSIRFIGNTTDTNQTLDNAVSYDPNGNTLLIFYNAPT